MQIGADAIGREASRNCGNRVAEPEARPTMPQVEEHSSLAGLPHMVVHRSVRLNDWELLGEHVRVHVARSKVLQDELRVGSFWRSGPEVHHDRVATTLTGFDGRIDGRPWLVNSVPG